MRCLVGNLADKFLAMIRDGTINPEKLIGMTSAQRRAFFAGFMGAENAQWANAMLESKLILKNQQQGLVTWAKQVAGLRPEAERSLVARVNKMEDILTPDTEDAFLEDLAAHALGTTVTMEEAGNITALAQTVSIKKETMEAGPRREVGDKPPETELEYGRALVAFDNYVSTVKAAAEHETTGEWASRKFSEYTENPFRILGEGLGFVAETSREARSSIDNSLIGRQGRNLFFKGMTGDFEAGKAWLETFGRSYRVIWETFKGKGQAVMDELRAEILSDPDYELMRKAKIATSVVEEEMPSDLPSRIPFLGKPFEASHNAFTASAHLLRYRTAQYYFHKARQIGKDLTDKTELEAIGQLVNSLTGRGEIGRSNKPTLIDNAFWSRRMMKADFDNLTAHLFNRSATGFVRWEAAKNLLRIIVAQAIILAIADLLDDDSVEWDPRATDAFKIKVGNTRFDIGGGMGAMVRLAARLAPLFVGKDAYYKNAKGKWVQINTGKFVGVTGLDLAEDFLENKASPIASVILSQLAGEYRFTDEKPTFVGNLRELYLPLSLDTARELLDDEESANFLVAMMLDVHGVSVSTYEPRRQR